jgi:hypothetical protein
MTLQQIKTALRAGPYAWPGGYPTYFVTADGAALSHDAVREQWPEIVGAAFSGDRRGGWYVAGHAINWEDGDLTCDHTGERIPSAYADE